MAAFCPICLVKFIAPALLSKQMITLSCTHVFHKECAEHWFSNADTCPECRHKIENGSVGKPIMVHESDHRLMKMLLLIFVLEEIERLYKNRFHYKNTYVTQTRKHICDLQTRFKRELEEVTEERGYLITAIDVGNSLTSQQIEDYNSRYLENPDLLFQHLNDSQMNGFKTIP